MSRRSDPSPTRQSTGGLLGGLVGGESSQALPPGVIATGSPRLITPLPPRPPGQQSPASRRQNIFQGTGLTIKEADKVVLPHILHHMTDSSNDEAISKNGFDHSKAKEDPENRFAFNSSEASGATSDELARHISRSRSIFFGLGEIDRKYMQEVKREDRELYGVDTSIHHAIIPSTFSAKLVPDEANPPGRNYHRIEGSVPATCIVAEPVENRSLALTAVGEHIKSAGYSDVTPAQVKDYTSYIVEKSHECEITF